jgi:hypothetical protein
VKTALLASAKTLAAAPSTALTLWNRFWFESDGRAQVRLFRLGFGLILLACYLIRSLDLDLFYGEHGIMTLGAMPELMPPLYRYSIFTHFTSHAAIWIGNGAFLASLLLFALGVAPRLMVIAALILHVSFLHRNMAVAYGVDTISCFFLFFLTFADYRRDRDYKPGDLQATLGSMAYRLFQIQICIIYGYSGLKKLKGIAWWNGDAVWQTLADPQLARFDFSWMAHFPVLLAAATFTTLAWEIYFPAVIWFKRARLPFLLLGIFLHLGIGFGINLPFFLDRTLAEQAMEALTARLARLKTAA